MGGRIRMRRSWSKLDLPPGTEQEGTEETEGTEGKPQMDTKGRESQVPRSNAGAEAGRA